MPERDFAAFLTVSLARTRELAPVSHARIAAALASLVVALEIDAGSCGVRARDATVEVIAPPARASVRVRGSKGAVLDLVEGRLTLLEALRRRRLSVWAPPPHVVHFDRALRAYVDAVVRTPGHAALFDRYREGASPWP